MIQVLYLNVGINDTSIILKCINDTTGLTPSHLLLVTTQYMDFQCHMSWSSFCVQ